MFIDDELSIKISILGGEDSSCFNKITGFDKASTIKTNITTLVIKI